MSKAKKPEPKPKIPQRLLENATLVRDCLVSVSDRITGMIELDYDNLSDETHDALGDAVIAVDQAVEYLLEIVPYPES